MDVLQGKILLKWMIQGYPYFRKPPNDELSQCTCKVPSASKEPMDDVSVLFQWYLSTHILATVWIH